MKEFLTRLMARFTSRKGQGMVEYGLIIGIVAVIIVTAPVALRGPRKHFLTT